MQEFVADLAKYMNVDNLTNGQNLIMILQYRLNTGHFYEPAQTIYHLFTLPVHLPNLFRRYRCASESRLIKNR